MFINSVDSTALLVLSGEATGSATPEQRRTTGPKSRPERRSAQPRAFDPPFRKNTRVFRAKFASILGSITGALRIGFPELRQGLSMFTRYLLAFDIKLAILLY
jgi:hypothetical protein